MNQRRPLLAHSVFGRPGCPRASCASKLLQALGADDMEGTVVWQEQLQLLHVRLRSGSQLVVEVHRLLEGQAEPELVAWAHAPILQVAGGHAACSPLACCCRCALCRLAGSPPSSSSPTS